MDPLTDREWWLVRQTFKRANFALAETAEAFNETPRYVANQIVQDTAGLRAETEKLLEKYDADPS
jgi:hypothetical protein